MKASDLLIKCLEEEGVEFIYGVPGEENLDMLESMRTSSIKLILTRHEQAAGFMAATYGRLTGKAGVCMATLGPGATNFVTAAAYAQLGAMPMVMITGPPLEILSGELVKTSRPPASALIRPCVGLSSRTGAARPFNSPARDRIFSSCRSGPVSGATRQTALVASRFVRVVHACRSAGSHAGPPQCREPSAAA